MARPFDVLLAATCDREKLVADVKAICAKSYMAHEDAWQYIAEHPKASEWLRIVARQEVALCRENNRRFFQQLVAAGICS